MSSRSRPVAPILLIIIVVIVAAGPANATPNFSPCPPNGKKVAIVWLASASNGHDLGLSLRGRSRAEAKDKGGRMHASGRQVVGSLRITGW